MARFSELVLKARTLLTEGRYEEAAEYAVLAVKAVEQLNTDYCDHAVRAVEIAHEHLLHTTRDIPAAVGELVGALMALKLCLEYG